MEEPNWLKAHYDKLDYQEYSYYSVPSCSHYDDTCGSEPGAKQQSGIAEVNSYLTAEVENAFNQLGVPMREGQAVVVGVILTSYR
ncbi:MAG: hypothetical protein ACR5LD_08380 [Symbiopectobacterium sp.]